MKGLHILLTYTCNYECDHCFVWGSPRQTGAFTMPQLEAVLQQAHALGSVKEIYFEGGEAFLRYPLLLEAIARATDLGFWTGVVSNGYWATDPQRTRVRLAPLVQAGLKQLTISIDGFHGGEVATANGDECTAKDADERSAARLHVALSVITEAGLEAGRISVNPPRAQPGSAAKEPGLPLNGGEAVMFRGRAADRLASLVRPQPWDCFTACPHENLAQPGRVHLDPLGYLHLCQGLLMGNLFRQPLTEIVQAYDPHTHPIVAPLLAGGPAELVRAYDLEPEPGYADACHLCYTARHALRSRFPALLGPDQMYGG